MAVAKRSVWILACLAAALVLATVAYMHLHLHGKSPTPAGDQASPSTSDSVPARPSTQRGELPFLVDTSPASLSASPTNPTPIKVMVGDQVTRRATASDLFEQLRSPVIADQRKAVAELFRRKRSLSDGELRALFDRLHGIANGASSNDQFRADCIWALAGIAMLAKERGVLTDQEIATHCAFLADVAGQDAADLNVRRVAIKAIGDLRQTNGIHVLTSLLADPTKWNTSELARPACIAIATLSPSEALTHVGPLLSTSTNPAVADTAAYALGLTGDSAVLPVLMANRGRLGDNLSVDNAIQALSSNVFATLSDHESPYLVDAIRATTALWKPEQQTQFVPLLLQVLQDPTTQHPTREAALTRLMDHASTLPLIQEKALLLQIRPLLNEGGDAPSRLNDIDRRLNAIVLEPVAIEPIEKEE